MLLIGLNDTKILCRQIGNRVLTAENRISRRPALESSRTPEPILNLIIQIGFGCGRRYPSP
jgi:hypothetical protein